MTVLRSRAGAVLAVVAIASSCSPAPERPRAAPRPAAASEAATATVGSPAPPFSEGEREAPAGTATTRPRSGGKRGAGKIPQAAAGDEVLVPHPGRYVFTQVGYEEFCNGGTCGRRDLPPTQPTDVRVLARSDEGATVVTETRASDGRVVRTTTAHRPEVTLITEVDLEFSYASVGFSETYAPDPPVRSILWPLQDGQRWGGEWSAETSGTYRVSVSGRDEIRAGGREVTAFHLDTFTTFSGDFEGTAAIDVWIDPANGAVVKTSGTLDVTSSYGRYRSKFVTELRRGPGY